MQGYTHLLNVPALLAALLFLAAGLALLWWGRRTRQATGLPEGVVVYSDTGAEQAVMEPIVSRRFGLVGKPDYLVRVTAQGKTMIVPLEVKSRRRPPTPAEGHVLQLGAYCLIIEDVYRQRPTHGYLRYADATLQIPFTDGLRMQVQQAADAIRSARGAKDVQRNHQEPGRCIHCGYRPSCGPTALVPMENGHEHDTR